MTSYYSRTSHRRSRGMDWNISADGMMDMIQRKPEALLLIGAGLALMMRGGRGFSFSGSASSPRSQRLYSRRDDLSYEGSRGRRGSYQPTGEDGSDWSSDSSSSRGMMSSAGDTVRSAGESVRSAGESASRMASETGENMTRYASDMVRRVSDTASTYASSATRWAGDARSGLMDRSHRLTERARSLPDEIDEAVQDHPLVLAALGVAIGAAMGATLPSTSIENRAMGQASDSLWDAAESATGRLGEAAEKAYDEAFRTAESHGLSKQGLKEMAKEVGSSFVSAAAGETGQGSQTGSSSSTSQSRTGGSIAGGSTPGSTTSGSGQQGTGASSVSTASVPGGAGSTPGSTSSPRPTPGKSS